MVPFIMCPKCRGRGRHRSWEPACDLCGGFGDLPVDFAERTAAPRRDKTLTSCEDCLELRTCVTVERDGLSVPLCAPCYAREMHPVLATIVMAEVPF